MVLHVESQCCGTRLLSRELRCQSCTREYIQRGRPTVSKAIQSLPVRSRIPRLNGRRHLHDEHLFEVHAGEICNRDESKHCRVRASSSPPGSRSWVKARR